MNCMIRKMKNALPPHSGITRGRKVSTQFSLLKIIYWGTTSTWLGTIMVTIMKRKRIPLPLNLTREKA